MEKVELIFSIKLRTDFKRMKYIQLSNKEK